MERGRAPNGIGFIERQRIELDDARIALQRAKRDLAFDRQVKEPAWRGRANTDACFRTLGQDGVDDFDGTRGVPEAVP